MSFDSIETSDLGRPVELYEFVQQGNFTRYTSAATSQFIGTTEYPPLRGLARSNPVQGNEATSGELSLTMPSTEAIPQQFRGTIPSSLPSLTIFRKHLNDPALAPYTWFKGTVVSCSFREHLATLRVLPPTRLFSRPIPRAVYSGVCNHQLYDSGCKANRVDYSFQGAIIAAVGAGSVDITITDLRNTAQAIATTLSLSLSAQEIDDFWLRGYLETDSSTPELRMITQTDIGGDPNTVRIHIPFRSAVVGSVLNVYAGCPHDIDFCNRKFNNVVNFGGFPQVPTNNPFNIELDSGRSDSSDATPRVTRSVFR